MLPYGRRAVSVDARAVGAHSERLKKVKCRSVCLLESLIRPTVNRYVTKTDIAHRAVNVYTHTGRHSHTPVPRSAICEHEDAETSREALSSPNANKRANNTHGTDHKGQPVGVRAIQLPNPFNRESSSFFKSPLPFRAHPGRSDRAPVSRRHGSPELARGRVSRQTSPQTGQKV